MGHLVDELVEQPVVLRRVVDYYSSNSSLIDEAVKVCHSSKIRQVILTGMGASLCSCYPLLLKLSNQGMPVSLWDTSELVNFAPGSITDKTLLIVISQSGESAEIKKLIDLNRSPYFKIGVTNSRHSSLHQWSDLSLDLCAGEEYSASTKTYLASLALLHLLGVKIMGDSVETEMTKLVQLAEVFTNIVQEKSNYYDKYVNFLEPIQDVFFLGRGYSLASTNYGALFFKEASKITASSLSAAQFRHGPMEIVRLGFTAIVMMGCQNVWEMNKRLVSDIVAFGGKVLLITTKRQGISTNGIMECEIPDVDCELLPMLEVIPIQKLAIQIASNQRFEAGIFLNSGKVTEIE
jgi:glucosamine--fructose-6-phosphate aminotransferase (isomerizing)